MMQPFYRPIKIFLLICAFSVVAAAQRVPSGTQLGQVQGRVVDAKTGDPVPRAHVQLQKIQSQDSPITTSTDSFGQFVLLSAEPGQYRLWAERTGYLRAVFGARRNNSPGAILVVDAGVHLRDLTLHIMPQSVIVGRVLDEDGEPVQDAHVQSLESSYVRGRRQLVAAQDTVTNDLGEFRLHSLGPGRYLVSAAYRTRDSRQATSGPTGAREDESTLEQTYAPTYYPNTIDPSAALLISVAAGEQVRGIDVTLLRTPTARIRGHVTNPLTGRSGRNIMVVLFPRDSGGIPSADRNTAATPDGMGNFELRGVTPGSYLLTAQWGYGSAQLPIEVGSSNINSVNLTISPNLEVRGLLRLDNGGTVQLGNRRVVVSLQPSEALLSIIAETANTDGTFVLSNVPPDTYAFNVAGLPDNYCVKDIRVESERLADGTLNLTAGSLAGALEVVLSRSCGNVEGVVADADGHSFEGATVVLVPQASRQHALYLYRTASTDQSGRFSLQGIAPGNYRLYAWEAIEGGAYLDPDFVHAYEEQGVNVSVEQKSGATLQLKLIPAGGVGSEPVTK
jgi:hypothetical protein